jgi:integrase
MARFHGLEARMSKKIIFTPASLEALKAGSMTDPQNPYLTIQRTEGGKLKWKFVRRMSRSTVVVRGTKPYPATTIAGARQWAHDWCAAIDAGNDPRELERARVEHEAAKAVQDTLTVDRCHEIYMEAVLRNDHKVSRTKTAKPIAAGTIREKRDIYRRNVQPMIGTRQIASIVQKDLTDIILKMIPRAPVQANRTGAEMRVFFNFCCGLRGENHGIKLDINPSLMIGDLWQPEKTGTRWLDEVELPLFLRALVDEERLHRRALLLLLLTGCRKMEVMAGKANEVRDGMWIIPGDRTKNGQEHPIVLGSWARELMKTNSVWIIPSPKLDEEGMYYGWQKVIARIRLRMEKIAGYDIEHFRPHDLRRTMRSHVENYGVDEVVAERMVNHLPRGLAKTYNRNRRAAAMAEGFRAWEDGVAAMARAADVAEALDVPAIEVVEPQSTVELLPA